MFWGLEIGSLADWVSGIGTMITIGVSFHLAHRKEKARFTVTSISGKSVDNAMQPQSILKVENIGYRPINIIYLGTSTQSRFELQFKDYSMERLSTIPTEMIVGEEKKKVGIFDLMGIQMNEMAILPVMYRTNILYDKAQKIRNSDNKRKTSMIFIDNAGLIYRTRMFITKVNEKDGGEYFVEVGKTRRFKKIALIHFRRLIQNLKRLHPKE